MDARQAAHTLEVIRTLMERTCQYHLFTARASLVAGNLAVAGALTLTFLLPDATDPWFFGIVWCLTFIGSLLAVTISTILRGRECGERIWSRQARTVLLALTPSLLAALILSIFFFARGDHLWLPGVWMLCYGQGALATAAYAPALIRWLGLTFLPLAGVAFLLGPDWAVVTMGVVFGLGHIALGGGLLVLERRQSRIRLHRSVA